MFNILNIIDNKYEHEYDYIRDVILKNYISPVNNLLNIRIMKYFYEKQEYLSNILNSIIDIKNLMIFYNKIISVR